MVDPILTLTLLGDFKLTYGGQLITGVNTERLQALLAYLVLHRQSPQPRQRLAFHFWADSTEAQGRTNLRRSLHYLRQALPHPDDFLQADTKTIQWRSQSPFVLDVAEFETAIAQADVAEQNKDWDLMRAFLEKAAKLYQGDLLPTCYDDWIEVERAQLQQTCIRALERLIRLLQEQQEYSIAIQYAQQLLRIDSLQETAYCSLIRLHGLLGDRVSALRVYQHCTEVLQQELAVEPGPATRQLYEWALALDRTPTVVTPPTQLIPHRRVAQGRSEQIGVLIGREQEWTEIADWMAPQVPNLPPILLLAGEPGIGKTRILEEIAATVQAEQGIVLWGRAFEAEMIRPYGVWIEILRTLDDSHPVSLPAGLDALLTGKPSTLATVSDRGQLFDAIVQILVQLAANSRRVAVIIDDIQWLDEVSVALLHYAFRLLNSTTIVWACAIRQQELTANQPVAKLLQALRREQRVKTIVLPPLSPTQTVALVQTIQPELDSQQVFVESGGNPLFALEIARAHSPSQTVVLDNLESLIEARFQQLPESARELIPWAAALGHHFSPTLIAQILDCSVAKLLTAIEQLEQHYIIRPAVTHAGELGYDFAHDIVRQVAYQQLSGPRRQLIHQQIAQVLNSKSTVDPTVIASVARHADLAGNHPLAVMSCVNAAEQCLRLFAYSEAAEFAEIGMKNCEYLNKPLQIRRQLELLKLRVLAGVPRSRLTQLEQGLHQWIAEAEQLHLKEEEAIGLEALLILNYERDEWSHVQQHSLKAAATGRVTGPVTAARTLAYSGSCLAEIQRDMPHAEALLLEAQSLAERVGLELPDIFVGLGCVYHYRSEVSEARQLLARAWKLAQAEQDHWRECTSLRYLAMLELEAGQPSQALTYCCEMQAVAARMSGEGSEAPIAIALEALAQYQSQHLQSEARLEQALIKLREIDAKRMLAYVLLGAAEVDLQHQRSNVALLRAQEAFQLAQMIRHSGEIALAWAILIQALWATGQYQQAHQQWQDLQGQLEEQQLSDRARRAIQRLEDLGGAV